MCIYIYICTILFLLLRLDKWNENMSQKGEKSSEIAIYVLTGFEDNLYYFGAVNFTKTREVRHSLTF